MLSKLTMKRLGIGLLALTLSLAAAFPAFANEEVYRKVAPSTAVVMRPDGGHGTGWVIDVQNRLLVTARHVVDDGKGGVFKQVDITLAASKDGNVITDWSHYIANKATLTVKGTVVYDSARKDMAIIQVPNLPQGMTALVLAKDPARPGQDVHVIGNSPLREGGVFAYCYGKVRTTFRFDPPGDPILAHVVAHQTPTNKGDSGGAVVNNKGEVVGFISQGTTGEPAPRGNPFHQVQVTDYSINAFEIKAGLDEYTARQVAAEKNR
jgi:S1-C subfamily serine protease